MIPQMPSAADDADNLRNRRGEAHQRASMLKKIQSDLVAAMKKKEELKLSTLRMLTSAIHNKEIEKRPNALTEDDIIAIVQSEIKKRSDAIIDYEKGGRPELAQKEKDEKTILEAYLPAQLSGDELTALVDAAIKESGASGIKDLGAVMKVLMPKVKGKATGNKVSDLVKQKLTPQA